MRYRNLSRDVESLEFWRGFANDLSITTDQALKAQQSYRFDPEEVDQELESLRLDGYCLIPGLIPEAMFEPMRVCIQRLHDANIPPVFLFVYDQPWQLLLELSSFFSHALNGSFLIPPHFFAWFVDQESQSAFRPHRDLANLDNAVRDDGSPNYLTIWVPLTDVAATDSCIEVVPRRRDTNFPHSHIANPKAVTALPAERGSLLLWNLHILHWGAAPGRRSKPRISIAYYIQRADEAPLTYPLLDLIGPLPFELRLALIGRQLARYSELRSVARRLESLHVETRRARVMTEMWNSVKRV